MRARLVFTLDEYRLLLFTGDIHTVSPMEACKFILNYDDRNYYVGLGCWDYEDSTLESYPGETIAFVDDKGKLHIVNSQLFRNLFSAYVTDRLLTVGEYAELHGKGISIVRRLCDEGRLMGAFYKGRQWLIPESTPYPSDARLKDEK
ncbi:MAG: hypothetical protein IJP35_03760 [Clostridia bacterium]|nr:hypothetical protein [Clostridia bacterium]